MTAPRKRAPAKRQPRKAAAPRQSQRDRLLGRPRPSLPYRILVAPDEVEQARAALAEVQVAARQARLGDNAAAAKRAAQQVRAAEAVVDACYETIVLRALPPERIEELDAEHPPTAEQMDKAKAEREQAVQRGEQVPEWPSWNDATYWPALLAESATEAGMTANEWAAFLAEHVSTGEAAGLKQAALAVNRLERVADPLVLPKGWTPTHS